MVPNTLFCFETLGSCYWLAIIYFYVCIFSQYQLEMVGFEIVWGFVLLCFLRPVLMWQSGEILDLDRREMM